MRPTWVVTQQPCPGAFAPTNRTPSRQSRSLTLAAGRGAIGGLLEDRVSADPRFLSKVRTHASTHLSA